MSHKQEIDIQILEFQIWRSTTAKSEISKFYINYILLISRSWLQACYQHEMSSDSIASSSSCYILRSIVSKYVLHFKSPIVFNPHIVQITQQER